MATNADAGPGHSSLSTPPAHTITSGPRCLGKATLEAYMNGHRRALPEQSTSDGFNKQFEMLPHAYLTCSMFLDHVTQGDETHHVPSVVLCSIIVCIDSDV